MNSPLLDLCGEHQIEPVPPEPHRLMKNVDATLGQQVLELAQQEGISDIHHHRQADHFG